MDDLEHTVRVRALTGNSLQHIPVLDNLAGRVEPEDIDGGPITVVRPSLEAVQDHEVSLCDDSLEFHVLARVLSSHSLKVLDKSFLAIANPWIVLRIRRSYVTLHSFIRL